MKDGEQTTASKEGTPPIFEPGEDEAIQPPPSKGGLLEPLKIPIFRALLIAATVGNIGGQMRDAGTGWLMTSLSPSAVMVGLVSTMAFAPSIFLMPLAGAVVDTVNRRRLLMMTQSFLCLSALFLALATYFAWITPIGLLTLVGLNGVVGVFHLNCWHVVVHDVVPREQLGKAVSLNSATFNAARSIGPAIAGVVIALAGPSAVFAIYSASVFLTIYVLFNWKEAPVSSPASKGAVLKALREGFGFLKTQRLVRLLIFRNLIFITAGMAVLALLPVLVRGHLSLGPKAFGILGSCFGFGAMSAALLSHALCERFGIRRVTRVGMILSMGTLLGLGVCTKIGAPFLLFAALILVSGFSWTNVALNHNVRARMSVPSEFSGRVLSFYAISGTGGMALGSLLSGWLTSQIGLSGAYFVAAGLSLIAFLLAVRHPMPDVYRE